MTARPETFGPEDLAEFVPADPAEHRNGDTPSTGSLEQRLADARVDLLARIEDGMPDRAWLPRSEHMLARGARHHVAAPLKSGKSLGFLAHAVNMVIAEARVVILDRENGADEYARRLRDILNDRPANARAAIRERLAYYAWPQIKLTDGPGLAAAIGTPDIVILDSTRTFLSGFQLDEDSSDDFAKFAAAIVDPLFRAGIATVQLDNTGHGDTGRARGSSSKGDLADVLYSLKTTTPFDEHRRGHLKLVRAHSRFGDVAPAFTIELGAGHFGAFTPDTTAADDPSHETFRPTKLMERVSRAIEETPGLSKRAIRDSVKGKASWVDLALELLIAEHHVRTQPDGQALRHHITTPYREPDDTNRVPVSEPCPNRVPDTGESDRVPVSPPIGTRDTGHGPPDTTTNQRVPGHGQHDAETELARIADKFPDAQPAQLLPAGRDVRDANARTGGGERG
jgi:hypothetical protein